VYQLVVSNWLFFNCFFLSDHVLWKQMAPSNPLPKSCPVLKQKRGLSAVPGTGLNPRRSRSALAPRTTHAHAHPQSGVVFHWNKCLHRLLTTEEIGS
jgi:hypothetical protein